MKKYLCLDTNVFEHFPSIDQIDWLSIVGCTEAILVIPQITIRELNKHKDTSPRAKLKRRAAAALSQLSKLARQPSPVTVRHEVTLEFRVTEPLLDFEQYHLTREMPDDYLIASAIELAQEIGCSPAQMVIMTSDLGLELKVCGQREIVGLSMPDELRLPEEPDADERRVQTLQEELKKLNKQLPDVSVALMKRIGDAKADIENVDWRYTPVTESDLDEAVHLEKSENPYLCPVPAAPPGYRFRSGDQRLLQQFNDNLNHHFARYRVYVKQTQEVRDWQSRTRAIVLYMKNDGGVPAINVEILLRFPEGISFIPDEDYRVYSRAPLAPTFDGRGRSEEDPTEHVPTSNPVYRAMSVSNARNFSGGSEVVLTIARLKHTHEESNSLNVHFNTADDVHSFQIAYEIWMANFPNRIKGILNVVVTAADVRQHESS